jgi:hypothetical protein
MRSIPRGKPTTRPVLVVALTTVVMIQALPAWAWGRLGHRVTSRIAEKYLNPKAKEAVKAMLDEGETLADGSLWADGHRRQLPKTAPWHYVDVPLDEPRYHARFSGDVPEKGCVVAKIHEFKATMKDPSRSVEDRRFALRFLTHYTLMWSLLFCGVQPPELSSSGSQ